MGGTTRPARASSRLLPALLVAGLGLGATGAWGQDTGGVLLSFGLNQSLRSESNPGLSNPSAKSRLTSRTQLSFSAVTETRTQRLALTAQGVVIAGDSKTKGFAEPSANLSYRLESANSLLSLSAAIREQDVDALDFFLDTDDATGLPVITSVSGTGTQRITTYGGSLEFGREAPFGGTVSLNRVDTRYSGTTDPSLIDSTRDTARLSLRFDLSPATTLTASASASRLDEVGAATTSTTKTLTLGLDHARPNGKITAEASVTDTASGRRESLSFGRSYDLPTGELTARIGVTSQAQGGTAVTGSLGWKQDLPNGALSLGLSRSVTGDSRDNETRLTRLNLGLTRELSPSITGSLNLGLQDSYATATAIGTRTTNISANLAYAMTEDWNLDLGATHRIRAKSGSASAASTTLTLALRRSFDFRP